MKVFMPGRILDRHVGGNTTYARALAHGLVEQGVDVQSMRFFSNAGLTMASETVDALQRRNGVLHFVADTGPLLPARSPSVVTVHGIASRWVDGVRNGRQERVWRSRVRRALACTDAVVTVSESSATDISEVFGVVREEIHVIPHGIDVAKFATRRDLSDTIAAKVPTEYLLYVGNIEPRKNLVGLVEAMQNPLVKALGVPLVVAGKPAWNHEEAMSAIESNDNVIYLGFVSDADRAALMQNAQLFVFPSLYEGFGFPVLEAMAAGAPVLTSHRGALEEVAGPAKILKELDSEAIAAGIEEALADTAWRSNSLDLGQAWSSSFTWGASIASHLAVYKKVIDR